MILGSRTSTRLSIFSCLVHIRGFTHLISMCLPLALFYSAATQSFDTEVAPSMGVINQVPLLDPVAESINDWHILLNIIFITSVGVHGCDRRPSVRRVLWLTMHNKLSQD
jgi:hypothetical protein